MNEHTPSEPHDADPQANLDAIDAEQQETEEREPFLRRVKLKLGRAAVGIVKGGQERINTIRQEAAGRAEQKQQTHQRAELDRHFQELTRDQENLVTDDIEILGESPQFKAEYHQKASDAAHNVDTAVAKMRIHNPIRTVRRKLIESNIDHLQHKIDRIEQKVAIKPNTPWNRYMQLRADAYKTRIKIKNRKLNKHTERTEKINAGLANRKEQRDETLKKRLDWYVHKKIEAERRKIARREHKSFRPLPAREVANYLAKLPDDEKKRITRQAILEIRKDNIRKGNLDWTYRIDDTNETTRKIKDYERIDRTTTE